MRRQGGRPRRDRNAVDDTGLPPPTPLIAPLESTVQSVPAVPHYARARSRLGAWCIDAVVAIAIALPFAIGAALLLRIALADCYTVRADGRSTLRCDAGAIDVPFLVAGVGAAALGVLLAAVLMLRWAGRGQTPGLRAVGLRLVAADGGGPIGPARAVVRALARVPSALPALVGFVWMLWDRRKQTWYDKISRTVVIRD
jgi:uncharacterized RDD family membrane protein YckC